MNLLTKTCAMAVLGACAWTSAGAHASSLIGDSIDVTLDGGIVLADLGVVVGPGVELQGGDFSTDFGAFLFAGEFIDIGATSISMAFDFPLGSDGILTFSDLDFGPGIGGVTLTSSIPTVTQSEVTFTANSITLDLGEWFFAGGGGTLNLEIAPVPLPAAFWLFAAAISGLGFMRRKA